MELYCDEEMFSSSDEEEIPPKIPPPKPRELIMWANDEKRWCESFVGKWRLAFSGFLDWWHDNIHQINKIYAKLDNKELFTELWTEIREFYDMSCETDLAIKNAMLAKAYTYDLHLDLQLSRAVERTMGEYPLTIWAKIDTFAKWCNQQVFNFAAGEQP